MSRLNRISSICLILASTVACKLNDNSKSDVKAFELSINICSDIQKEAERRFKAAPDTSLTLHYSRLLADEKSILAYELPRYKTRAGELKTTAAPANGPSGKETPLTSVKPKPTADNPKDAKPSGFALSSEEGLNLAPTTTVVAREVCPGCSASQIESNLRILESNNRAISSCTLKTTVAASTSSAADSEADSGLTAAEKAQRAKDVEQIKNIVMGASNAKALCEWWGTVSSGTGASRDRCQRDTIIGFCSAALKAAGNVTADVINDKTDGKIVADIAKTIPGAVKTAITGCVQQLAYDTLKDALRNAGTRDFLPAATQQLAKDAIKGDKLSDAAKADKAAALKKEIALLICKAGTALIAGTIDETPQINYDNPCQAVFARSKSRAKACLNTTASGCKIAAGDIDLRNFFPEGAVDERPIATLATEAGNILASMGCKTAGKAGTALCGTISEAASQIRKAITTGNNDWAHCIGTDQAGACTGTVVTEMMLGVKVADFKEPVLVATPSPEAPGYFEKEVCWCDYSCYQDDWGSDKELSRSNFYTVISRGDAGKRECNNQDGRWNWTGEKSKEGYSIYWKKRDCGIYKARSKESEGFNSAGGFEVFISGKWVYKNMSGTAGSCPSGL